MKKYKYVSRWSDKIVDESKIKDSLDFAWRYTPSKNNFMNYNVFVLGPNESKLKELLYYKCLESQSRANGFHITGLENLKQYEQELLEEDLTPNFLNVKDAPYILLYTHRIEDQLNDFQKRNVEMGMVFEQTFPVGTTKYHAAKQNAKLEIGMFSANFATKCLEHDIDVSYVGCMPTDLKLWKEPEWSFITYQPVLLQLAGHGKVYRRSTLQGFSDLKPEFDRVVKFVEDVKNEHRRSVFQEASNKIRMGLQESSE